MGIRWRPQPKLPSRGNILMKTLLGVLLIVLLVGCIQNETTQPDVETPTPQLGIHEHHLFEAYAQKNGKTTQETNVFFQTNYGLANENSIYQQLPAPSTTFLHDSKNWDDHNVSGLLQIPTTTYLQPEFYPTFEQTGTIKWINASGQYNPTAGLASIPADQETTIPNEETTIETVLFIGGTWGATHYQGLGLHATITPQAPFTIEFDPSSFVVGPTFPAFAPNWVQRVHVTGVITPQEGVDTYTIRIYPNAPDPTLEQKWLEQYTPYTRANETFTDAEGLATLTIHVQPKE